MWTYEHTLYTTANPAAVWALYSDVSTWPSWDDANEVTILDGPFEAGTRGKITFRGQDPLPFTLITVDPQRFFADETDLGGFVIRFEHQLTATATGVQLVHRVSITGAAADQVGPELGPTITAGIPTTMAALAALAQAGR